MGYLDNTGLAYLWGKIKAKLVQPDWSQNDATAPDYVKNRPGGYYDTNSLVWDGVVGDNYTVTIADGMTAVSIFIPISLTDYVDGKILVKPYSDGESNIITITNKFIETGDGYELFIRSGYGVIIIDDTNVTVNGIVFSRPGTYFICTADAYVASLTSLPTPVKIPQKYLDVDNALGITGATVGQIVNIAAVDDSGKPTAWEAVDAESDNIVLASSTAGSTKKFRLTVDDSGTLSTVEVTDAS